jgi:hypothetical protein
MKTVSKIFLILVVLAALAMPVAVLTLAGASQAARQVARLPFDVRPVSVQAYSGALVNLPGIPALQVPDGDRLVLGGTFELKEGETLQGSLVVLGGVVTLQAGSKVEKDVVLMGGTLQALGTIQGDIVTIGGLVDLGETAVVEGNVNVLSGNLVRAEGAQIEGRVNNGVVGPFSPVVIPTTRVWAPGMDTGVGILFKGLSLLLRSFMWAIVALLVVLLLPNHSERARQALVEKPGIALGLGLLTVVIVPLMLVVIAITIIGIPASLAGVFLLAAAWAFGVIVVGLEVGKRLVRAARQEWAPAVAAGLGAFLVTIVANTIGAVVPCIGWMVPAIMGMLGLGAVLMTRFGTQDYQPFVTQTAVSAPSVETPQVEPAGEAGEVTEEAAKE